MHFRGSAILSALAVVAMVSLLLAGASTYVVSYNTRLQKERNYQSALSLAEAGINSELRYASLNITTTGVPKAHTISNPYNGSVNGVDGSFKCWVEGPNGAAWGGPPNDAYIKSVGTVGDVSRSIAIMGIKQGIFADYSVFGTENVDFGGSYSYIKGTMGTNGVLASSSVGTSAVEGTVWYCGPGASGPTGANVAYQGDAVLWPTVDDIVNSEFGSWTNLKSSCSNSQIRQFTTDVTNVQPSPTNTKLASWPSTKYTMKTADFNPYPRYNGGGTLILPPGDYYFTNFNVTAQVTIFMDTAGLTTGTPGRVRIFMPTTGVDQQDTFNCTVVMTSGDGTGADRLKFRIYDNKTADMSIGGSSAIYGGYYAIRNDKKGSFTISGSSNITGAIIANHVKIGGGSTITFPNPSLLTDSKDYALWYGFADFWQEKKLSNDKKVFVDGTDN